MNVDNQLLGDINLLVDKAITDGFTIHEFRKNFCELIERHKSQSKRLKLMQGHELVAELCLAHEVKMNCFYYGYAQEQQDVYEARWRAARNELLYRLLSERDLHELLESRMEASAHQQLISYLRGDEIVG